MLARHAADGVSRLQEIWVTPKISPAARGTTDDGSSAQVWYRELSGTLMATSDATSNSTFNPNHSHRIPMTARLAIRTGSPSITSAAAYLAVALWVICLGGCGGEPAAPPDSTSDGKSRPAGRSIDGSPPAEVDRKHPVVSIETSEGSITVRLDAVQAPGTVRNFLNYANEGFYDNTLVHYIDPGKMILAGGYAANRQPKRPRTAIRNEAHNGLKNVRGTIAMTRDPQLIDSATSQFFINLTDAPHRDHQGETADTYGYCVFGEVIEGLDVADRIANSPATDLGGDLIQTPDPPVLITTVRIVR
jgi:cyclophilin family peptidyl-prolyl cis-trans isomerase